MSTIESTESVELVDGVLKITVATDAAGTSLSGDAMAEGADALHAVNSGDVTVGAVLLVGSGPNFCAGGNVRAFAGAPDRGAFVRDVAEAFHRFVLELSSVTVPVVAGVHGWAAGAGMSLVCHTDVAIGSRATKLRPAYPGIGFTPDGGLTWTLPRIVGSARARDILLNDSILNGEEAVRLGILSRLVGDDIIASEAERLARTFAAGATAAFAGAKALLARSETSTLTEQLEAEAASISAAADSRTGREGVDAFVEKRRPDFS
ncbi:enoyl-CoA hydratase-related protein [Rhodococcus sp. G-MC3]|uniref:enoyl-CoA hydratase-related protein n=1 Tax=Rhodococcus sp. G-MC3 TaxID=3046209 RepID=UPI0024BB4BD3|nr:enoyl-CoA hydratase-related protein [Rhodococcus sp. G-MC3]MDJ0391956.1 enoyl-CoA hydratase-related protein [Rhodococcus sp. G-MC3]